MALEGWNGCVCSGGGGSSDLSTASVTLNLTADDDTSFIGEGVDTTFNFGASEYQSNLSDLLDHVAEIVMYNGEARINAIYGFIGEDSGYYKIVGVPVCTGGVEYVPDEEYFVVTGDGTITATLSAT